MPVDLSSQVTRRRVGGARAAEDSERSGRTQSHAAVPDQLRGPTLQMRDAVRIMSNIAYASTPVALATSLAAGASHEFSLQGNTVLSLTIPVPLAGLGLSGAADLLGPASRRNSVEELERSPLAPVVDTQLADLLRRVPPEHVVSFAAYLQEHWTDLSKQIFQLCNPKSTRHQAEVAVASIRLYPDGALAHVLKQRSTLCDKLGLESPQEVAVCAWELYDYLKGYGVNVPDDLDATIRNRLARQRWSGVEAQWQLDMERMQTFWMGCSPVHCVAAAAHVDYGAFVVESELKKDGRIPLSAYARVLGKLILERDPERRQWQAAFAELPKDAQRLARHALLFAHAVDWDLLYRVSDILDGPTDRRTLEQAGFACANGLTGKGRAVALAECRAEELRGQETFSKLSVDARRLAYAAASLKGNADWARTLASADIPHPQEHQRELVDAGFATAAGLTVAGRHAARIAGDPAPSTSWADRVKGAMASAMGVV